MPKPAIRVPINRDPAPLPDPVVAFAAALVVFGTVIMIGLIVAGSWMLEAIRTWPT
jgi:hypothetical protein